MCHLKKLRNDHTGPIKVVSIYVLIQHIWRAGMVDWNEEMVYLGSLLSAAGRIRVRGASDSYENALTPLICANGGAAMTIYEIFTG